MTSITPFIQVMLGLVASHPWSTLQSIQQYYKRLRVFLLSCQSFKHLKSHKKFDKAVGLKIPTTASFIDIESHLICHLMNF